MYLQNFLSKLAERKEISRTLLFAGGDRNYKEKIALEFAARLLSDDRPLHPDLHLYRPEGKLGLHPMQSIIKLVEEVNLPPFQAPCKVFILFEAQRMLPICANALLKTLEEPLPRTALILLAPSPRELLPTIVSRVQTLYFRGQMLQEEADPRLLSFFQRSVRYSDLLREVKAIAQEVENVSIEDEAEKSLYVSRKGMELLHALLIWFRDQELLKIGGSPDFLFSKGSTQQPHSLTFDKAQKILQEGRTYLQRSMPLAIVLENMLIRLTY